MKIDRITVKSGVEFVSDTIKTPYDFIEVQFVIYDDRHGGILTIETSEDEKDWNVDKVKIKNNFTYNKIKKSQKYLRIKYSNISDDEQIISGVIKNRAYDTRLDKTQNNIIFLNLDNEKSIVLSKSLTLLKITGYNMSSKNILFCLYDKCNEKIDKNDKPIFKMVIRRKSDINIEFGGIDMILGAVLEIDKSDKTSEAGLNFIYW